MSMAANVAQSMKASNLLVVQTDYTLTNTTALTIQVTAPRAYPVIQSLTVLYKGGASGLTNVRLSLWGKLTATGDSTQIGADTDWNCTSAATGSATITNTTATLWQYYTIKFVGTGTGTAVVDNQNFQIYNATYPSSANRIIGTGGITVTGATVNLNASSNFATNIGTGTTTQAVTVGNAANTITLVAPTTVAGTLTATGGFALSSQPSTYWGSSGHVALATSGTDVACTNGGRFWVSLNIPYNSTITGLAYLIGSVGGTDSVMVQLCNSAGVQVATSKKTGAHHGDLVGTAAQFQSVDFTTPYAATSGRYFAVLQFSGTTAKFRAYPIPGARFIANTSSGTWDVKADITPGTSFVVDKAPFVMTY